VAENLNAENLDEELPMLNSLDIAKEPSATRVVVAMSGGVDSSVVAAMMKREGYDVIGITLQLYDHGAALHRKGACCAGQDIHDARRVAEMIGIPHYVLDYESRFREAVIENFADSYLAGETPIPCVECNRSIKFRDLLDTARELGADVLATGHYVASRALPDGRRGLYRAADASRDQSYFLYATTPDQLDLLRFPLAEQDKAETRALARELGLVVAEKADSQDICFVPQGRYSDVITKLKPNAANPGDIVHLDGRVMGRHEGIIHYTIGQRKGLGIAVGEPLFVVALDADGGRVIVGPREALATSRIKLRDVNWLGDVPLEEIGEDGIEISARVRSTRPPKAAILRIRDGGVEIELLTPEDGVSPGQACVFYASDEGRARVLGGGTIMKRIGVPAVEDVGRTAPVSAASTSAA
jgi:tRNA-uridine 2-sulfurtransferase